MSIVLGFLLGFLAVIGGACVLAFLVCLTNDLASWWRGRELRHWPTVHEWHALDRAITIQPTDPARIAYRKLRYKYARKTGE
jgi:hypothetical protein